MTVKQVKLVLEDQTEFLGQSFGADRPAAGEVVFNTGMVGYPETLTDPSYRGQLLALTYPLVGNYGVPGPERDEHGIPLHFESGQIQISGLLVCEYSQHYSHFDALQSLGQWLADAGIPAVTGIDTRALTRRLREKGTMLGKIVSADDEVPFFDPRTRDMVSLVSPKEISELGAPRKEAPTVVLLDCGCKGSIARSIVKRGIHVVRVPYDHYFLDLDYDGLLISNGPGDPQMCAATIRHVEHALAVGKPILGICLGHQILALAGGAETYKLKFGHRSQNQPCVAYEENGNGKPALSKRCVITSQNHGYAVRADRMGNDWRPWFQNANDGTIEGIRHRSKPFWGVQFHPEAKPGPTDTAWIFDEFTRAVKEGRR